MPATEKTWRDQLKMHVIFGVSALVMLLGTVWMLWKDHNREWRNWQLADRARVRWTVEAQLAQAEAESQVKLQQLNDDLLAVRSTTPEPALVRRFMELVAAEDERLERVPRTDLSQLESALAATEAADEGTDAAVPARNQVLRAMETQTREARRREDSLVTQRKFTAADHTAKVSERGIAIGAGRPASVVQDIEDAIEAHAARMAELDVAIAEAKEYRQDLEAIVAAIRGEEAELERQIAAVDAELGRLRDNLGDYTTNAREWIVRGPILDALYTGNIKLDQLWLPDMTINYNFSHVPRYDRCINCHRAIDATAPGSAVEPAYPTIPRDERERIVQLATPDSQPQPEADDAGNERQPTIESFYGLRLAPRGQVDRNAVTVQVVFPESRAAIAGLETGDVIQQIAGSRVRTAADVEYYLLRAANWGQPLRLQIRRGLDHPYTSHPRLDLFVGSLSPHKKEDMGCTICHDGQGSASEFKWASHTPNDPEQALNWSRDHGWFDNHHWIFPMTPQRFIESNCLKCHHEVVELEPSDRFPEPPAPKLVRGFQLVRDYGCFGCHEIGGFDGPDKRIGPDLRLEPNFHELAAQILQDDGLSDDERSWAETLAGRPESDAVRHRLMRSIQQDVQLANSRDAGNEPRLTRVTHALAEALKDSETPGTYNKVGPSLRHLDAKVDFDWLYSWIRRPADFRPSTRMPEFFGHLEHLNADRKEFRIHDAEGNEQLVSDREYTERFEHIEIRALAEYLLAESRPFEYADPAEGVTETPSAERGRWLFESRGCLACHAHSEFPGIESTHGPDLSQLAAKLDSDKGRRWLYSWLKSPHEYHARTVMPDLILDPITETDPMGEPTGTVTDPAADIVAFLLDVPADWQPEVAAPSRTLSADEQAALADLTAVWLSASFPRRRAEQYAREGIPERIAATVKTDEAVLVGDFAQMSDEQRAERQLEYVARRSLSRYGCFGCHDIPGQESAQPIGTPLAGWGRKDTSQLAFENIETFLATHGLDGQGGHGHAADGHGEHDVAAVQDDHGGHAHLDPGAFDTDTGFFVQSLVSHQRTGFLWQKLRMPRSFDYQTTRYKRYDERLRMPKFPFDDEEREAVMTFILGLTNEAPAERYIYQPGPREEAIVQGRHVLDKFNCAGCHILDMERWDIAFEPDWFDDPPTTNDFPFLAPTVTADQLAESLTPDRRGLLHAQLRGMPVRDEETGEPSLVDEDGVPFDPEDEETEPFYEFALYEHAVVSGAPRLVGQENLLVAAKHDGYGPARGTAFPGNGGDLAKYLYPRVIAEEKKVNPAAVATEAWGWLPPPLHDQGEKTKTDWLHDFLMDPTALRPAVVMRMPNFHMTSAEASRLVNYFAAKSDADFPYEYNDRRRRGYLAQLEQAHPELFDHALNIVTDTNYCVQCHSLGDYQVRGAVKTLGPNLDEAYRRLRPEFVRRWIANPQRILPYTGMPVNIPFAPEPPHFGGVSQQLFPGTSIDQLDGLVDFLMNFDEYARRQTSVRGMVRQPADAGPAEAVQTTEPRDDRAALR